MDEDQKQFIEAEKKVRKNILEYLYKIYRKDGPNAMIVWRTVVQDLGIDKLTFDRAFKYLEDNFLNMSRP